MGDLVELTVPTTHISAAAKTFSFLSLLIFPDVQSSIHKILTNVVQVIIDVIGTFTNIINIIVFSRVGFTDGVTVALFGLAISDLGYLFLSAVSQILDILDAGIGLHPFEPMKNLAYQVLWWNNMFYDVTIILTSFNAIQKCACVAIPLIFKSIFTTFRSKIIVTLVYAIMLIYYIPIFSFPGKSIRFDFEKNWTRLGNYYHPDNETVYAMFHIFSRILLPFVSQAVVLFCTIVLIVKLKAALKNRRAMGLGKQLSERSDSDSMSKIAENKSSTRELRAIQTVLLVSAIFVVCNLPDILITFTEKVYPEFSDTSKYENTYRMCSSIQDIFAVTNSAVNIAVYLKYNTKYRRKFFELMSASYCRRGNVS